MPQDKYTHMLVISDRTGSMGQPADGIMGQGPTVAENMVKALKGFFIDQAAEPGKCLVDFTQFDTIFEYVYRDVTVGNATASISPRGMTALLDAIGKAVTEFGEKLSNMEEANRPGRVMVIIVTDGLENASQEWSKEAVKALIEQQQSVYNWTFVFLGANMDAVSVAGGMGIAPSASLTYDTGNVNASGVALSAMTTRYRSGGEASFTEAERQAQKKKKSVSS
jgi:hypothetical protein